MKLKLKKQHLPNTTNGKTTAGKRCGDFFSFFLSKRKGTNKQKKKNGGNWGKTWFNFKCKLSFDFLGFPPGQSAAVSVELMSEAVATALNSQLNSANDQSHLTPAQVALVAESVSSIIMGRGPKKAPLEVHCELLFRDWLPTGHVTLRSNQTDVP